MEGHTLSYRNMLLCALVSMAGAWHEPGSDTRPYVAQDALRFLQRNLAALSGPGEDRIKRARLNLSTISECDPRLRPTLSALAGNQPLSREGRKSDDAISLFERLIAPVEDCLVGNPWDAAGGIVRCLHSAMPRSLSHIVWGEKDDAGIPRSYEVRLRQAPYSLLLERPSGETPTVSFLAAEGSDLPQSINRLLFRTPASPRCRAYHKRGWRGFSAIP